MATDMHNTKSRKPETIPAETWMGKHLEKADRRAMLYGNAEKMLGVQEEAQYVKNI